MAPVASSADPAAAGGNSQYSFKRHLIWFFASTVIFVALFFGTLMLAMAVHTKMAPGLTEEKFNSVHPGMSLNEVRQILGPPLKSHDLTDEEDRAYRDYDSRYRYYRPTPLPPGTISHLDYSKPANLISEWTLYRVELVNGIVVHRYIFPMDD